MKTDAGAIFLSLLAAALLGAGCRPAVRVGDVEMKRARAGPPEVLVTVEQDGVSRQVRASLSRATSATEMGCFL